MGEQNHISNWRNIKCIPVNNGVYYTNAVVPLPIRPILPVNNKLSQETSVTVCLQINNRNVNYWLSHVNRVAPLPHGTTGLISANQMAWQMVEGTPPPRVCVPSLTL